MYLIDSQDKNPYKTFKILKNEILCYNPDLSIKPEFICRTKSDIEIDLVDEWNIFRGDINVISSVSGDGIKELVSKLIDCI